MKYTALLKDLTLSSDLEEHFVRLGHDFEKSCETAGANIKFMRDSIPREFRSAPRRTQEAAIGYLDFNLRLVQEMIASGESVRDTRTYLWRALKKLDLVPPADLMNYIEDEDIVEIYFLDEIQAFRNMRFFEITSFTVEEVLCRPWFHLVGRDWRMLLRMFRKIVKFKLGFLKTPEPWDVPEHVMYEKDTPERLHFSFKLKYFIPLKHEGRLAAMVGTNRTVVLS